MINPYLKSQLKANKIRIWIGIIALVIIWPIFIIKDLLTDLYLILLASFTLYTIFAYIIVPLNKNKKLKEQINDEEDQDIV